MEEQGSSHPWFAGGGDNNNERPDFGNRFWAGFGPFGPQMYHGRPGSYNHSGQQAAQQSDAPGATQNDNEKEGEARPSGAQDRSQPEAGPSTHGPGARRGGSCGMRGRGGWGHRGRGPWGPRGGFPMGGLGGLANMFQDNWFGEETKKAGAEEFTPDVDVFDTPESFVIHVSLPGAKKEDVGVNWDADKSELSIAGVVYRPGDEELLKHLAMDERKVGAFEKKVRLGSRANPAQVDIDSISARMEDGVLRVDVPKLDSGYVEIKKVDIE